MNIYPNIKQITLSRIIIAKETAKLIVKAGGNLWGNHSKYPTEDWKDEVMGGNTHQGYWEWVFSQIEAEEND